MEVYLVNEALSAGCGRLARSPDSRARSNSPTHFVEPLNILYNATTPVFIVGYGDVGYRVADRWMERGAKVRALVRRPIRVSEHMHPRLELNRGDLDDPATLPAQAVAGTRLYYFAPPPGSGDTDTRMRHFVEALPSPPEKVVLISTTGVYGDCGGEWVDETRPPNPGTDRARRRLDAERVLSEYAAAHDVPLVILRVAGIYGPGRLPEKRLREQTPLPAADDCGFTNRIHVDDLVEICVRAMAEPELTGVFNVCDGAPGTMRDYFDQLADTLGYARLPVLDRDKMSASQSTRMATYLDESRRMDNRKILEEMGVALRYPDLQSALVDLRQAATAP